MPLLDYFPNVKNFMFSTNALMGGEWIYDKFFLPLYNYCEQNKRKLNWDLQLSLDGPPEFNDDSRHEGATEQTISTARILCEKAPQVSEYLTLDMHTKVTLDVSYMRIMNQRGIGCFNWYFQFFDKLQREAEEWAKDKDYIRIGLNTTVTTVDPGIHTIDDGKTFAEWISHLIDVDRTKLPTFEDQPLYFQIFNAVKAYLRPGTVCNPLAHVQQFACSAGRSDITIDHKGNIFGCNRLARNMAMSVERQKVHSMRANTNLFTSDKKWLMKTWGNRAYHEDLKARRRIFDGLVLTMAKAGQILPKYFYDSDARTLLFYSCCSVWCHIGNEEDLTQNSFLIPTSILKLLGNGAVDELLKYCRISKQRGDFDPWKIVP